MSGAGGIQQGPVQFVPAKNIKDAEKFAKKYLADDVSYKGVSADIANLINEELFKLGGGKQRLDAIGSCARIGKITNSKSRNNRVLAAVTANFDATTGEMVGRYLQFSTKHMKDINTMETLLKRMNSNGQMINVSKREAITHEWGHLVDATNKVDKWSYYSDGVWNKWKSEFSNPIKRKAAKEKLQKEVGSYMFANNGEFFAESYRLYKHGKLPRELSAIEDMLKIADDNMVK